MENKRCLAAYPSYHAVLGCEKTGTKKRGLFPISLQKSLSQFNISEQFETPFQSTSPPASVLCSTSLQIYLSSQATQGWANDDPRGQSMAWWPTAVKSDLNFGHPLDHQQSATTSLAPFSPKYPLSFGSESLRFSRSGRLTVSPRDMTTMAHFLNLGFSDAIRHWILMEKTYVVSVGERSQKTGAFVHVPAKNGSNAVNILGFLVNILVWKMPLTSMVMTDSSFIIMRSMESKWKETSKCLIATKYHPSSVILKINLSIVKPKWQGLNHAISVGFNPVFNCCVSPRGFRPYKLQPKQPDSHRSFQYLFPMVSTLLQQYRIKHALV